MSEEVAQGADARRWSAYQVGTNSFAWSAFGPHGAASGHEETLEDAQTAARDFAEDGLPGTKGAPE